MRVQSFFLGGNCVVFIIIIYFIIFAVSIIEVKIWGSNDSFSRVAISMRIANKPEH